MAELRLTGLSGHNPLGFLAALGALQVAEFTWPGAKLSWDVDDIVPTAILTVPVEIDELCAVIAEDRDRWKASPLLAWPGDRPMDDVKLLQPRLDAWLRELSDPGLDRAVRQVAMGLVAQGPVDGKGNSKPTHLHFTAGQQRFLTSVREVCDASDPSRVDEALIGPWRFDSLAKSLSWDAGNERVFALRGFNPSKEQRSGVPGADWLAFIGLSMFPTTARGASLITTGCERGWKVSSLAWPLWSARLGASVVTSVLGLELRHLPRREVASRGISCVLSAPIRRSDQGGYGSFGASSVIVQA